MKFTNCHNSQSSFKAKSILHSLDLDNMFAAATEIDVLFTSNLWKNKMVNKKAKEVGLPYQTIINLLVHQYSEGKIQLTI